MTRRPPILTTLAALALLALSSTAAQAESLLALKRDGGFTYWDTSKTPPVARFEGVKKGKAGVCYRANGKRLAVDPDPTACLGHLRLGKLASIDGPMDIVGRVKPLNRPVNDYFRGFKVTGVKGVEYCGERENCDEIYILGVRNDAALQALVKAARSGKKVRLKGAGVFNLESIDLAVDQISPAR